MRISRIVPAATAAGLIVLALGGDTVALAAPVTVQLRVEGSAQTLFEGPVSVEGIPDPPGISLQSSEGAHPCDVKDDGQNGGFGADAPTPTAAVYDAATASGLAIDGTWASEFGDFLLTQIGPDVQTGAPEYKSWGYAVNFTTAGVGGCQFQLAPGSEVLWAYNYFNLAHLLTLSGPGAARVGAALTVHVADGQTGQPIAGAQIGEDVGGVTTAIPGSPVTDSSGNATISLAHTGTVELKASEPGSVRSNAIAVCVHDGDDGTCGTTAGGGPGVGGPGVSGQGGGGSGSTLASSTSKLPGPPSALLARVLGITSGHVYSRRSAPRLLAGSVSLLGAATLHELRIRLQRRYRSRCWSFSGARAAFVRSRRCKPAAFFSVGSTQSFTYLLPARLGPGRYVFDVDAVDASGRVTGLAPGVSHVRFRVR